MAQFDSNKAYDRFISTDGDIPPIWDYVSVRAQINGTPALIDAVGRIKMYAPMLNEEDRDTCSIDQYAFLQLGVISSDRDVHKDTLRVLTRGAKYEEGRDFVIRQTGENGSNVFAGPQACESIAPETDPTTGVVAVDRPRGGQRTKMVMVTPPTFIECLMRSPNTHWYGRAFLFVLGSVDAYDSLTRRTAMTRMEREMQATRDELVATREESQTLRGELAASREESQTLRRSLDATRTESQALRLRLQTAAPSTVNALEYHVKTEHFMLLRSQVHPLECCFAAGQASSIRNARIKYAKELYVKHDEVITPNKIVTQHRLMEIVPYGIIASVSGRYITLCVGKTPEDLMVHIRAVATERSVEAAT
jgi:hypothetical protein